MSNAKRGLLCLVVLGLTLTSAVLADDPAIRFSTWFGGSSGDVITDVALDTSGNVYLTGFTTSDNFPLARPLQDLRAGQDDIFIAKFNHTGDTLLFSTYLGGEGNDQAVAMALDSHGNLWITGWTTSTNFPRVAPLQAQLKGESDAFVVCLSGNGALLFSTYLGGSGSDRANRLVIDHNDNVHVVGSTNSVNFPVVNALIDTLAGSAMDAFVCRIDATTRTVEYATYFGGSGAESGIGIAVATDGTMYFAGTTDSPDLPTHNPLDDTLSGGIDLFVASIRASGQQLLWSTYYGGASDDIVRSLTLSANGDLIIAGKTLSANLPLYLPLQDSCRSCPALSDGFVLALDKNNGARRFCTYLGGATGEDEIRSVTTDDLRNVLLAGSTTSVDFPLVSASQGIPVGMRECFVAMLTPDGGSLALSSYFGGSNNDEALAVANTEGLIAIAGKTQSNDLPVQNSWQHQYGGGSADGFVVVVAPHEKSFCGDLDGSGELNVSDVVFLILYIFADGGLPHDERGGDVDCDGAPTITDAVYLINYIFGSGGPPCSNCR
jgi:hypothetical protein